MRVNTSIKNAKLSYLKIGEVIMKLDNVQAQALKEKVYKIGTKLGLSDVSNLYPFFSNDKNVFSEGESVYVDGSGYHFVAMERGKINKQIDCKKEEEILYAIFSKITFALASEFEFEHRKANEDSRRQLFAKQMELLESIDAGFAKKAKRD